MDAELKTYSYAYPLCPRCHEYGMVPWFDGDQTCIMCGHVEYADKKMPPMPYVGNNIGKRVPSWT